MRLDHLLSKEQHTVITCERYCPVRAVGGGSRRSLKGRGRDCSISFIARQQKENELTMAFWVGTLLGPETTHVGVGSLDQSFSALLGPNRGSLEVFFVGW